VADAPSGVHFTVPFSYLRASVEHFDATLPPHKIRHSVTVKALSTPVLQVDVWDNPSGLSLQQWFDAHLAFSVTEGTTVTHRDVGRERTEAIVVDQPRSPQSDPRRIATFATGGRIVRVTCYDSADPSSVTTFDEALATFGEVAR